MNVKIDSETPEEAILRVLGDGDTEPVTLHRIVESNSGAHSPRAISAALLNLRQAELIEQAPGGRGVFRLTDAGVAAISELPEPYSLDAVIPHPGPQALDLLTGELAIGVNARGDEVSVPLWNSIGTRMFVASGVTGAGTTNVLGGFIEAASAHVPHVRTWLVDTGRQLSEYADRVDRTSADEDASIDLLHEVLKVQRDRNRLLAQIGKKAWNTPFDALGLPLGLVVISSLNDYASLEFHSVLGDVLGMARKTGIVVATDVPSLALPCFHYNFLNRETFLAGTVLRMRSVGPLDRQIGNEEQVRYPQIDATFEDGSTTAGLAYLPNGQLLRAFWASGL
jgi:hypothetical protein